MKLLNLCLLCVLGAFVSIPANGACRVEAGGPGEPVRLENQLVTVTIYPERGGTVGSYILKATGVDLTATWQDRPVGQGFGLFIDRVVTAARQKVRDYETSPYAVEVVKNTPEEVAVRLTGTSPTGVGKDIRFAKTYRLQRGSTELTVDYEVANISQGQILTSIWTCGHVRAGDPATPLTYFYPTPTGTREEIFARGSQGNNIFVNDAPVGWCAAIRASSGCGLAAAMDYQTLGTLYTFMPSVDVDQNFPTFEWWTQNILLKPVNPLEGKEWAGEPWRSSVSVMPLQGLERVDGYRNGLAIAIDERDGQAQITLLSATDREVALDFGIGPVVEQRAPGTRIVLPLEAGVPVGRSAGGMNATSDSVVRVTVLEGTNAVCRAERAFGPPEALVDYRIAPREEKLPEPKIDTRTRLTRTLVTPHVKWATPAARGPLKVLFVVRSSMQREIVELAERMDLDYHIVPTQYSHYKDTASNAGLMFYYPGYDSMADLHTRLANEDWDVICICSRYWTTIPEKTRELLLGRVKEGGGRGKRSSYSVPADVAEVFNAAPSVKGSEAICAGIPFAVLPALAADPTGERWVTAIECGQGRIVKLNYGTSPASARRGDRTSIVPYQEDGPLPEWPAHEYYYSLVIRGLQWAAHRLPDGPLSFDVSGGQGLTVGGEAIVRVTAGGGDGGVVRYVLHPPAGDPVAEGSVAISSAGDAAIPIPRAMAAGPVLLDVWRMEGERIADWGTALLRVRSAVDSMDVRVPEGRYEGDTAWTIEIHAEANAPVATAQLVLEIQDMHGRLVWRSGQEVALAPGTNRWALPLRIADPLTIRHRVQARITQGGLTLGEASGVLYAACRPSVPNFTFLVWEGGWRSHVQSIALEQMRKIGVTDYQINAVAVGSSAVDNASLRNRCDEILRETLDISLMSVNWMGGRTSKEEPLVRLYCLDDPAYMESVREGIATTLAGLGALGVRTASTGDEISFGHYSSFNDLCQSPHSIAAFRRWLEERYGSINALNREWETTYAGFADVPGIQWADVEDKANKAPWVDFRTHTEITLQNYLRTFNAEMKKAIPGIKAGFDGNSQLCSYNGFDWWRLSGVCDFLTIYRTGPMHYYLSSFFAARGTVPHFSTWTSTSLMPRILAGTVWRRLFTGMTGVDYWYAPILLNPDFTVNEYGAVLSREVPELQRGIGSLLLHARREHDPVAILYSQASLHAATIEAREGRPGPAELSEAHFGWAAMLEDAGLTPEFISYEQLAQGYLREAGHRVLILPLCYALSEEEAATIVSFVEDGGVLVADGVPGVYDGHGRRLARGQLNTLLGIERTDALMPQAHGVTIRAPATGAADAERASFMLPWGTVARDMAVTDAIAWGEGEGLLAAKTARLGDSVIRSTETVTEGVPAVVQATRGQGQTFWMNLPVWRYEEIRGTDRGQEVVTLLGDILATANVQPLLPVTADGDRVPELVMTRFRQGEALYAGLIKRPHSRTDAQDAVVSWPRAGYIYDVRAARLLGRARESAVRVSSDRAELLAWLPYEVTDLSCTASDTATPLVPVDCVLTVVRGPGVEEEGGPTDHLIHCTVTGPDGTACPAYTRNILAEGGQGTYRLTFALNDAPGRWTFTARDTVSGKTVARTILLSDGAR